MSSACLGVSSVFVHRCSFFNLSAAAIRVQREKLVRAEKEQRRGERGESLRTSKLYQIGLNFLHSFHFFSSFYSLSENKSKSHSHSPHKHSHHHSRSLYVMLRVYIIIFSDLISTAQASELQVIKMTLYFYLFTI